MLPVVFQFILYVTELGVELIIFSLLGPGE